MPLGSPFNLTDTSGFFFTTPTYNFVFSSKSKKERFFILCFYPEQKKEILLTFFFLFLLPTSGSSASASPLYISPPSLVWKPKWNYVQHPCSKVIFLILFGRIVRDQSTKKVHNVFHNPKIESLMTISLSLCCIVSLLVLLMSEFVCSYCLLDGLFVCSWTVNV